MTKINTFSINEPIENIVQCISENGCVVIENILDSKALSSLKEELQPHLKNTTECKGDFYGYKTKRFSGLVVKSPTSRNMITNPTILEVMGEFLLEGCDQYQLNLTQAISIGPQEPQQIIHRDDSMFPYKDRDFEAMINCMFAVDDFTKENGATHIVPGSHKWELDRIPEAHEVVQATMKAGSVLIYLGSLIHGGGANKTENYRTGVVISYCCGWLRQAENQYLAVPIEQVKKYSKSLQELLGYFVHKPNLGSVEGQDPMILLSDHKNESQVFTEFIPEEVQPIIKEYRANQKLVA